MNVNTNNKGYNGVVYDYYYRVCLNNSPVSCVNTPYATFTFVDPCLTSTISLDAPSNPMTTSRKLASGSHTEVIAYSTDTASEASDYGNAFCGTRTYTLSGQPSYLTFDATTRTFTFGATDDIFS